MYVCMYVTRVIRSRARVYTSRERGSSWRPVFTAGKKLSVYSREHGAC